MRDVKKLDGRLEQWYTEEAHGGHVIWGYLHNDPNRRFMEGAFVYTSLVFDQIIEEGVVVQTTNSRYLMGKQREVISEDE